jgi:hypothetical protein
LSETQREVKFQAHQPRDERKPPPGYENFGGEFVTPQMKAFIEAAKEGKLPNPEVPELPPEVISLAQELMVIHLPEWKNPAGRKMAGPTSMRIGGAVRLAEYLLQRGISFDPEKATVRWVPTPGGQLGASDPGKHIYRNPDGTWPEPPDLEAFWSLDQIECHELPDGRWTAIHPRGPIEGQGDSKDDAFATCVMRVRAKIRELKGEQ